MSNEYKIFDYKNKYLLFFGPYYNKNLNMHQLPDCKHISINLN